MERKRQKVGPLAWLAQNKYLHELLLETIHWFTFECPRRMRCLMDVIPASSIKPVGVAPTQTHFPLTSVESSPTIPFSRSRSSRLDKTVLEPLSGQTDSSLVLRYKAPRWHEQLQCWCLNFRGRVTVASVKNFQLVTYPENGLVGPEHDKIILLFGKWGKTCLLWTISIQYQLSRHIHNLS